VEYPVYYIDYEGASVLRQAQGNMKTSFQLVQYIQDSIQDFNTYTFNDKTIYIFGPFLIH
jgi:hypothetical protein